ncbi:MAG: hypothetical protein J7M17_02270 [Anaerolineae bacterium]|nr:hypothetical protein [Anaerolineae bacterium]
MELVNRYVHEIGRRLPKKQRADIEDELRSLLIDALEGQITTGATPTEDDVVAVLREFGSPADVAAQYASRPRYLIGPELYDVYRRVIGIVLGATAVGLIVSFAISLIQVEAGIIEILQRLGEAILQYIPSATSAIGFTTIIFAILERTLPPSELESLRDKETWDPRDLPPVEDAARIKPVGIIVGTCFIILALVLLNLFPEKLGIAYIQGQDAGWHIVPLLSAEALIAYLPLWNISWILMLGLNVLLLRQDRWRLGTRIFDLALTVFNAYVIYQMITGPTLFSLDATVWMYGEAAVDIHEIVLPLLSKILNVGLIFGLIATLFEAGEKTFRLVKA